VRAAPWIAALLLAATAAAAQTPYLDERLGVHRQLQALNTELLNHDSATGVLQTICDRLAPGQKIMARKSSWAPEEGSLELAREDLGVGPDVRVGYRQVELTCAGEVLSSAENWYLPGRLTPEMNRALEETRTPFGVVVGPLKFRRRTLSSEFLYEPLPQGWEREPKANFEYMPSSVPHVLRHRAVLATPDGRPFSVVVEMYTDSVLAP
jgi:hypothetical protein